jgi:hypothetical protein
MSTTAQLPPDGFHYACALFMETVDYSTYIHDHGCAFDGTFTCCHGINNTMLETFARDSCGTGNVCGIEAQADLLFIIPSILIILALLVHTAWPRIIVVLTSKGFDPETIPLFGTGGFDRMGLTRNRGESNADFEMRCMAESRRVQYV